MHPDEHRESEAQALAKALASAEAGLKRAQMYIGLLRQYDPELPQIVATAREEANSALAAFRAAHPELPSDPEAALRVLQGHNASGRALSDEFLRKVAESYQALATRGEQHLVKALAASQCRDKSTVSRWIKAARDRGILPTENGGVRLTP